MKPCINCGKQLPDGAHFCPYCTAVQNKKQQAAEPKPRGEKRGVSGVRVDVPRLL